MNDFVSIIQQAGIVGAGGAGFPTHAKLNAKAKYVLVNGAECEPLLQVDQQLMALYPREILTALNDCVTATQAEWGILGIKHKYHDALAAIYAILPEFPKLKVHELDNVYPAGDEQYIVAELTGEIVPEGGIPLMVGSIVLNVETLFNIYEAVYLNKPVTETFVTITGAVRSPMTLRVPVGVTVQSLIDLAGGTTISDFKVIDGGPMMGKVLSTVNAGVKKASKGYVVLPADHDLIKAKEKSISRVLVEAKTACCHCDLCTEVCPRYLQGHSLHPSKLMRLASYGSTGEKGTLADEAYLCCECGLCEQACIMNLQPWKVNSYLKAELAKNGIKNSHKRDKLSLHPFRTHRAYPVKKLTYKLGLGAYIKDAPMVKTTLQVSEVKLASRQHIGQPGVLQVKVGDKVVLGDVVFACPKEGLGANIHASLSGKVIQATDAQVIIQKD